MSITFSPILNYIENEQYKSNLPMIEVDGFLTNDRNERYANLEYSVLTLEHVKQNDLRYYLKDIDIDPQLVGEYVRISGYLENNYSEYDGFDYAIMPPSVKVIYVKELKVTSSPLVFDKN